MIMHSILDRSLLKVQQCFEILCDVDAQGKDVGHFDKSGLIWKLYSPHLPGKREQSESRVH